MAKRWCGFLIIISVLLLAGIVVAGCGNQSAQSIAGEDKKASEESVNSVSSGQAVKTASAYNGTAPLPPDMLRINNRGKLIVSLYYEDRIPWFYLDKQGQLTGLDVKMARDIARELGVDVAFDRVARSFNEVVDRVAAGQADIAISKLSVTLARAQRIRFTQPYIVFHQAVLANRLKLAALQNANPGKTALELILNTTDKIGVTKGTSYEEFARDIFPKAQITGVPHDDLFGATARGELLASLYDENEIDMFIKQNPELAITTKVIILKDRIDPIAIAVAPQDHQLLSWLNHYLEFMKYSVDIKQQVDEYIGGLK
ncbi:MAG: ABC transporter substrate-binding protein [Thermincola sp.]|jgi:ABC-type amino acid transport substrate-binding protein|nr:ABC transporter substrate-binding protein [Thermincola sp.]MDT3702977.1 ABC transporter substrate-binding protein [Thermincola sp.]